jgi:ATP:ADP antiporter, AAA family
LLDPEDVMAPRSAADVAALLATVCSTTLIAEQVGGKATRDALFLTSFSIRDLPTMLMVSAVVSLTIIPLGGRAMTALGPSRIVPLALAGSAVFLLSAWALAGQFPRAVAAAVYLHVGSLGSVLISWFWSLINERFDPRTAKHYVARIAGGATLGGLLGGILAERLAKPIGLTGMLPVLAGLHLLCGGLTLVLRPQPARPAPVTVLTEPPAPAAEKAGLSLLWRSGYVRDLALLVSLSAIGAALLDYALKAQAAASYGRGAPLLRFFGLYYTATSLATVLVQTSLTRRVLERFGLARTVATLPFTLGAGGVAALLAPNLWCLAVARGAEGALRNSLFRSGYELFYTPMRPAEKRSVKTMIDVGGERLGDLAGGGIVKLVLVAVPALAIGVLMALAIALGCLGLLVARRLHRGYTHTLERSLLDRATAVDIGKSLDRMTLSVILGTRADLSLADVVAAGRPPTPPPEQAPAPPPMDPLAARAAALRSGDRERVHTALRDEPLTPPLVAHAILLLGWDEVAPAALEALRRVAASVVGQLTDALVDPATEFTIRRRLPRVLTATTTPRAIDGLLAGLEDPRFEVRYQCGRALARVQDADPSLRIPGERALAAVLREVTVDRGVWESQRLLDRSDEATDSPFVDRFLRDRANRSLEHVFTLLSLTLPKQPLIVAFRGLHTGDQGLRGTALEYLEVTLPEAVRVSLWPFLEERPGPKQPPRPRAEILAALMQSNASIEANLQLLREKRAAGLGPPGPAKDE